MVMEHQAYVHNMIARANVLTRTAMYDGREMNKALGRPEDYRSESTTSRLKNAVEPLVKAMLFSEEAALTDAVKGGTRSSSSSSPRTARGTTKGRSLRDFDLKTRMFKYPCSYLIYSAAVRRPAGRGEGAVLRRLFEVLSGRDQSKEFAHLSADDRVRSRRSSRRLRRDYRRAFVSVR